ncbi:PREDICTED: origin recognition complex subunit 6 [Nanorana parkeri]|uniref:origin recognition complex subunit 6 n=1 Tax=Nanorana parkeri TaxID=125878 RepID=UPI000854573A|nr:PREDICTED: origin recognition complex subunit 6 [Nanorana parkeri]
METDVLRRLAPKLGISSARVLGKAEELLRLSQLKCAGLSAMTTATSSAVMCLQLAATSLNHPVDKDYLVRLSGLNRKVYQSCLQSFECLLGVDNKLGIRELAVQYGCMEAVNIASKILSRYETTLPQAQQEDLDLSKPLFITAALYSACRCLKLKVEKNKLVASSGVKKGIFERLCTQLEKIGMQICQESTAITQQPRKKQKTLLECIEQNHDSEEVEEEEFPRKQVRSEPESKERDYEEWKRKILQNAAKAANGE